MINVCLHQQGAAQPLRCWHQSNQGTYQHTVKTDQSIVFQLKDQTVNLVLAEREFEVVKNLIQYRHRRRNVGSDGDLYR